MAIGDIHSAERGSGARYNDGKDPMELVPVRVWRQSWRPCMSYHVDAGFYANALDRLVDIQEGRKPMGLLYSTGNLIDAARVFAYGAQKYAAWNWAKGMQWSVPIGCCLRHMRASLVDGEALDPESGLPHLGHVMCNLIMLDWFMENYPEGNDCIPAEAFADAQ